MHILNILDIILDFFSKYPRFFLDDSLLNISNSQPENLPSGILNEEAQEAQTNMAKMLASGVATVSLLEVVLALELSLVHLMAYGRNPFENLFISICYFRLCFDRSSWIIGINDEFSILFS
jgi:hypothetical protein